MTDFDGFPAEAITFYEEIREHNDKQWFEAHKPLFRDKVQRPAQRFVKALGERLETIAPAIQYDTKFTGSGSIMRIYRDVRFSQDKSPYKTNLGIGWWEGAGKKTEVPGFYFQLDADGAWMGGGLYMFPKPFLDAYRQAVDDDKFGPAIKQALAAVNATDCTVQGERYKRVPRGFDAEHPRAELLKYKGLVAVSPPIPREALAAPRLVDVCFGYCRNMLPLQEWLVQAMQFPSTGSVVVQSGPNSFPV